MLPQVVIIGAGPAGSTAALLLARAAWRVTLLEQHRFPRDKVCGECLSSLGIDVLQRTGLADALRATTLPTVFTRTLLHSPRGGCMDLPLPRVMWGLSRERFDSYLLDAARDAGARVLQPARCEQLDDDGAEPHVRVRIRSLTTNSVETLYADLVLLADGKGGVAPDRPPPPTGDFGIKAHFADVAGPRDAIELFGARGCYGGLAAIERDRWNAAFSVSAQRLRAHAGDVDRLFAEITSENDALSLRLREARRLSPWLAAPLPRFPVRARFRSRTIPLGNAAAALEPIGGEGMGLAMRSAELAVRELLQSHERGRPPRTQHLVAQFTDLWQRRRVACRALARAVSSPRLADFAVRRIHRPSMLTGVALRLIGKSG